MTYVINVIVPLAQLAKTHQISVTFGILTKCNGHFSYVTSISVTFRQNTDFYGTETEIGHIELLKLTKVSKLGFSLGGWIQFFLI